MRSMSASILETALFDLKGLISQRLAQEALLELSVWNSSQKQSSGSPSISIVICPLSQPLK